MKDYYNYINLNGITIGNHEFDYSIEKLKKYISKEKFQLLCANLYNKKFGKYIWDGLWKNVEPFHIFTLGGEGEIKIRIGVISLFKAETVLNTSTDLSDYHRLTIKNNFAILFLRLLYMNIYYLNIIKYHLELEIDL